MNTNQLRFDEDYILHKLSHYLPAQNPLKDFVHHNTLHAFQKLHFFEATQQSSEIFGYKTYLSLNEFRSKYKKGDIDRNVFNKTLIKRKGIENSQEWTKILLEKTFDENLSQKIGKLRAQWKTKYGINLDKSTHGILFRVLCNYLDQGISIWQFPVHNDGFLSSLRKLNQNGITSFFKSERVKTLFYDEASIGYLLKILIGNEFYFENYLFDQQFAHPGWSGIVNAIEHNTSSLLDTRKITLKELITFELLLEIDALDQKFGSKWQPLSEQIDFNPEHLFSGIAYSEYFDTLSLWQEINEWSFYNQVLFGISKSRTLNNHSKQDIKFQALFCMDDRECSLRRHIEFLEPKASTFGTAAFFNFEFYYQPVNGKFYTKLCPAPVTPKYLIKELPRKKKPSKDLHYNKHSHSLLFGWIISQTLGFSAAFKLFLNIFKPTMSPATTSSFKHLSIKSELVIENDKTLPNENGLQVGFTIEEMANRVEGLLKSIGLVENFAPIVYVIGHGATSVNNTHFAGYDCGACSGRPSSVNAKIVCFAANHPEVRKTLANRGIIIPEQTQFAPGLHDTTRDEIAFYDESKLTTINSSIHKENQLIFKQALQRNANERARRFDTVTKSKNLAEVHEKIKKRSVSLFEPRPELNHATNAICIVGKRDVSDRLFLDRRSFLNSFDYKIDPNGDYLAGILGAVAPVAGGINLEYYFSRVDNQKLGAGSKLPHNVMGLIGVANGIDGDLRPGLPSQMIEVHDPLRILIIVEHKPEVVKNAISRNPATYEWFINEWVNLVVYNPDDLKFYRFQNGSFEVFTPFESDIKTYANTLEYTNTSSENLKVSLI